MLYDCVFLYIRMGQPNLFGPRVTELFTLVWLHHFDKDLAIIYPSVFFLFTLLSWYLVTYEIL